MRMFLVLAGFLATAPAAYAAVFHAEGDFVAGSPASFAVMDACGTDGATEGIDSSCVALPAVAHGRAYLTGMTSTMGGNLQVCFYDAIEWLVCDSAPTGIVPADAMRVSFSSLIGAQIHWTFDV